MDFDMAVEQTHRHEVCMRMKCECGHIYVFILHEQVCNFSLFELYLVLVLVLLALCVLLLRVLHHLTLHRLTSLLDTTFASLGYALPLCTRGMFDAIILGRVPPGLLALPVVGARGRVLVRRRHLVHTSISAFALSALTLLFLVAVVLLTHSLVATITTVTVTLTPVMFATNFADASHMVRIVIFSIS